jgi:hypothetical protein
MISKAAASKLLLFAIGLEPAKCLASEGDHVMAAPESRKELEQEGPEAFLDGLRISLVSRGLEGNGVGERGVLEGVVERAASFPVSRIARLPGAQDPLADEFSASPNERLAQLDLIFPQVAAHDANSSAQGAGVEDRLVRVFPSPLVNRSIHGDLRGACLVPDQLDQVFDRPTQNVMPLRRTPHLLQDSDEGVDQSRTVPKLRLSGCRDSKPLEW